MRLLLLAVVVLAAPAFAKPKKPTTPATPATPPAAQEAPAQLHGPARLDFTDPRLIQGQTNKAGSVYLYERKELKNRSMVKLREDFREELTP